jgi:hypothetical protein
MARSNSRKHWRLRRFFSAILLTVAIFFGILFLERDFNFVEHDENQVKKLALLFSFGHEGPKGPHRQEILAAIALNVAASIFDSIHVIYDAPNKGVEACRDFSNIVQSKVRLLGAESFSELFCHPRRRQPTYYEMFQASQTTKLKHSVVILSNADMVFSILADQLRHVKADRIGVISTRGFDLRVVPDNLVAQYATLTDLSAGELFYQAVKAFLGETKDFLTEAEALQEKTGFEFAPTIPDRCYPPPRPRLSWDAYVFHPTSISISRWRFVGKTGPFHMNELGAENVALSLVMKNSKKLMHVFQLCDHIPIWHFHLEPKSHHAGSKWIEPIHGSREDILPTSCGDLNTCLGRGTII